ncbi:MAG: hypothetical protein L6R30_24805 [Thermoanaerobaculia bacterium]|nr:hypothetical protein [Thermoanaerobaculia bacterium]
MARLLVSEILLYNEKAVREGRIARDLHIRLRDDIERSLEVYVSRVPAEAKDFFQQELVRILADGDEGALGRMNPPDTPTRRPAPGPDTTAASLEGTWGPGIPAQTPVPSVEDLVAAAEELRRAGDFGKAIETLEEAALRHDPPIRVYELLVEIHIARRDAGSASIYAIALKRGYLAQGREDLARAVDERLRDMGAN